MKFARFLDDRNRSVYVNPNSVAYVANDRYESGFFSGFCVITFVTNKPECIRVQGTASSVAFTLSEASK